MGKIKDTLECVKNIVVAGAPLVLTPVGAALLTLANECFNSSDKMRQEKWKEEIITKIANLDKNAEEKIKAMSNFASLLASAQRGALEDLEEDKVGLYANTIINAIKNERLEDTKKHIFLNMLREFTILHIKVLEFFTKTHNKANYCSGGFQTHVLNESPTLGSIIQETDPTLLKDRDMFYLVLDDLISKKLLVFSHVNQINIQFGEIAKQTTKLANEFLAFISEQETSNG